MNGHALFFGDGQNFRKQKLLNGAEKLVRTQAIFPGCSAAQQTDMKDNDVLFAGLQPPQGGLEVIESIIIANGNENVAGTNTRGRGGELIFLSQIKLIQFSTRRSTMPMRVMLRDNEDQKETEGEAHSGKSGNLLGEEIYRGKRKKGDGDETQADWNFSLADLQV